MWCFTLDSRNILYKQTVKNENENGTIIFDNKKNTETEYYTGNNCQYIRVEKQFGM